MDVRYIVVEQDGSEAGAGSSHDQPPEPGVVFALEGVGQVRVLSHRDNEEAEALEVRVQRVA